MKRVFLIIFFLRPLISSFQIHSLKCIYYYYYYYLISLLYFNSCTRTRSLSKTVLRTYVSRESYFHTHFPFSFSILYYTILCVYIYYTVVQVSVRCIMCTVRWYCKSDRIYTKFRKESYTHYGTTVYVVGRV